MQKRFKIIATIGVISLLVICWFSAAARACCVGTPAPTPCHECKQVNNEWVWVDKCEGCESCSAGTCVDDDTECTGCQSCNSAQCEDDDSKCGVGENCCGGECCQDWECCNGVCCNSNELCWAGMCCPVDRVCGTVNDEVCCAEFVDCCGGFCGCDTDMECCGWGVNEACCGDGTGDCESTACDRRWPLGPFGICESCCKESTLSCDQGNPVEWGHDCPIRNTNDPSCDVPGKICDWDSTFPPLLDDESLCSNCTLEETWCVQYTPTLECSDLGQDCDCTEEVGGLVYTMSRGTRYVCPSS